MSVTPGQFIGNSKKKQSKNLTMSVGQGVLGEGSFTKKDKNLNSGIFSQLDDYANLPDEIDDLGSDSFNNLNYCELCEKTFNKLKGVSRHHCRKCNQSVCQSCSNNKRKLAKNDDTLYRVCDYCDCQLSNFKLEQNQVAILKAQTE